MSDGARRFAPLALLACLLLSFSAVLFASATESEAAAAAEMSSAVSTEVATEWKPRLAFRSSAPAARHRFFLPNPCILEDERTGARYDLTGLRRTGSDYTAIDGDYSYRMNVCGPVSAGGPCGNALVCQYTRTDNRFVAKIAVYDGYFGPRLTLIDGNNPGLGVQSHYLNGDICFLGPTKRRSPRTTIIHYRCAAHTSDTFTIHEDKETCTFTITLETDQACWPPGSGGGLSNGSQFLILFFLAVAVYVGGGYLYLRNQGKEGSEALPHLEWWTVQLPALVKDGIAYSLARFQDFKEKRLKNGSGGLLGNGGHADPDDPYKGAGAPTARSDDL